MVVALERFQLSQLWGREALWRTLDIYLITLPVLDVD
jgi:hypothetical protein